MKLKSFKKSIIRCFMAVSLMLPCSAFAGLNDGLVGYWTFDEGIGIVANDVSGNGNTGAINGASYVAGHDNTALSFDGTNEVVIPDAASLNVQLFTISAWVYPTSRDGVVDIIVNKEVAPSNRQYELGIRGILVPGGTIPAGNIVFNISGISGQPNNYNGWVDGHASIPLNTWTHVALTFNGNTAKVLVNGSVTRTLAGLSGIIPTTTAPLKIGNRSLPLGAQASFSGLIDEVKVYNRALADCEVSRLAGGTGQCLVAPIQTAESPSRTFSLIDPEFQQEVVDGPYGGVGTAWTANKNLLRRVNNRIVEYNLTQDRIVNGTSLYSVKTTHIVPGLSSGHGITNGTDGFLYANSPNGLYRVDPNTWTAVRVASQGYWHGIGTLPDGRIVRQSQSGRSVWVYNPADGSNRSLYYEGSFIDDLTTTSGGLIALASLSRSQVVIIDSNGVQVNRVRVRGYTGRGRPDGMAFGGGSLFTANTDGSISRFDFSGPNFTGSATEIVVAYHPGGYGDLSSVGPDGAFYITQRNITYDNGARGGAWSLVRLYRPGGFSTPPGVPSNKPPVADAGAAQAVDCTGASSADVTLDGSASTDPDGDALTYAWSWAGGSATGVSPTVSLPLGTTVVTLTVSDPDGETDTATVSITVQDNTAPTVNAGADHSMEATSTAGAAYDVSSQVTASDTCCAVATSISPIGTYPLGSTTVNVTATDCAGNSASDVMVVTVVDTTPPTLTVPADVSVEANGYPNSIVAIGLATATDLFAVTITSDAPADYPLGTTVVNWTATDANGNVSTGTQDVTVSDTTAPVLTLPADVSVEANGDPNSTVAIGLATATDLFSVIITTDAPADYPLGTTVVNWTATDTNGNASTGTQNVTVSDTTAPILTVPGAVSVEANGDPNSTVAIGLATATDLFAVTITSDAPADYPLGTTVVNWTATDANGNVSTGTQDVTVSDTTAPILTVPGAVSVEANADPNSTVAIGLATATDLFAVTITSDAPADYPLGTTVVNWTATDANGNASNGSQNVTVTDTTAPVITIPADVSVEANADPNSTVAIGLATATDLFAVTITSDAPADYPLGTTVVNWTATDANGNASNGSQNVTVTDTTPPALTVPGNVSVEANAVSSTVNIGTATATDIFGATVTNDAPATFPLGTTTVTYTATDGNGLITTGSQTVTVVDTTGPALTLPADVLNFEATGVLTPVAIGTATATDIFNPVTVSSDAPVSYPLGTTVVTWTATDANGNVSTGTQNVTVVDTTAPVVTATLTPFGYGDEDDNDKDKDGHHRKDSDEGRFMVQFTVSDIADANPTVSAVLNVNGHATPITVTNGQIIEFEYEDEKTEVEVEDGMLEIEAPAMTFNVTATDASGNTGTASAQPQGLSRDNDDDYYGTHGKKEGKHEKHDD